MDTMYTENCQHTNYQTEQKMKIMIVRSMKPSQVETMDIRMIDGNRVVAEMSLNLLEAAQVADYIQKSLDYRNQLSREPVTLGEMEAADPMAFANPAQTK